MKVRKKYLDWLSRGVKVLKRVRCSKVPVELSSSDRRLLRLVENLVDDMLENADIELKD